MRIVKVFWNLSADLAHRRHFPAIDWIASYSLYSDQMNEYFDNHVDANWSKQIQETMQILQEESELEEIVRLVGVDALSFQDRLTLECSQSIREDYLHQSAFDDVDTYSSLKKQNGMLSTILDWYHMGQKALDAHVLFNDIIQMTIRERIARMKYVPEDKVDETYKAIKNQLEQEFLALMEGSGNID